MLKNLCLGYYLVMATCCECTSITTCCNVEWFEKKTEKNKCCNRNVPVTKRKRKCWGNANEAIQLFVANDL